MKKRTWLVLLATMFSAQAAFAFPGGSVRVLLGMLIRDHALKTDTTSEKGCGSVVEAKKGDPLELGDLLAFLVEKTGYGEGKAAIRPECDQKDAHKTSCFLWFATGAGTPAYWRVGLKFDYDPAKKKVLPGTISCVTGS